MRVIRGRSGAPSRPVTETFTGVVWQDNVLPATDGVVVNNVTFTPCARTYWHRHEGGQLLLVTQGRGLVCADGEDPVELRAGDTVFVPAGEKHWHGGAADSLMSHTAISFGTTEWLDALPEDEYRRQAERIVT